ncbi:MAG TPA: lipid II flippase MurJ [Gemmatimonadales bacterium]|jgi:putative peptidoglycan lipid II flippase
MMLSIKHWRTPATVAAFVIAAKGLAFGREAVVASELGVSASSDAYYLAFALPTVLYNLLALPFSLWVTARLKTASSAGADSGPAVYRRALLVVSGLGAVLALGAVVAAPMLVTAYAPGLEENRLAEAVSVTRIGVLAIPALGIQAVGNGKLFATGRFATAYGWLALSGLVGLVVVIELTPRYGAAGAVSAFVAAGWTAALGGMFSAGRSMDLQEPGFGGPVSPDEFGPGIVYRACVMQVFFQGSLLLMYAFGSVLPPGELAASLFGSKVQAAVYETVVVTVGAFVYPRIAQLLHGRDHRAVWDAVIRTLSWLLPATAGLGVLLVTCRREIVALIYERHAFDERAAQLVASALLGYAPGIAGLTLVEIVHRAMVLRGQLRGYLTAFSSALMLNWLSCYFLVPRLGVPGLTLSSSVGVLVAGTGLVVHACRRLESVDTRQLLLLVLRTTLAAGLTLIGLTALHPAFVIHTSAFGKLLAVASSGVAAATILTLALLALGHRWQAAGSSAN